jgi:hypothetical protein
MLNLSLAYVGNGAPACRQTGLILAKECELQFFRRYCGGFCGRKELELVFRLDFLFLFDQAKRNEDRLIMFIKLDKSFF